MKEAAEDSYNLILTGQLWGSLISGSTYYVIEFIWTACFGVIDPKNIGGLLFITLNSIGYIQFAGYSSSNLISTVKFPKSISQLLGLSYNFLSVINYAKEGPLLILVV